MGKIIVDKPNTAGIVGPDGSPLSATLPKNLPEFLVIGVHFIKKLTQEPTYASALVFPAREYFEKLKENPKEVEIVQFEAIFNAFARELYEKDRETFNSLNDAQDLQKYLQANYEIAMSQPILANSILQVTFSEKDKNKDKEQPSSKKEAN